MGRDQSDGNCHVLKMNGIPDFIQGLMDKPQPSAEEMPTKPTTPAKDVVHDSEMDRRGTAGGNLFIAGCLTLVGGILILCMFVATLAASCAHGQN